MVWKAFCGGNVQGSAPFTLHYDEPSAGPPTVEMMNREGVFFWEKRTDE